jgi:hypothetical protein
MSLLTNKGKEAISTAISSSGQFSLVRIGFGDKQGSIYRKFVESDTSLVNEKFRINLDSVYYLPTVDNNTILKITANLTPEQSATMEAVTVREFGIYDNFNNLLIVGDTVPTITKDSNNNNGIDFEINLTLPTSEKVAKVLVTSKEGEFSNAERIKLNSIEEGDGIQACQLRPCKPGRLDAHSPNQHRQLVAESPYLHWRISERQEFPLL